MIKQDENLSKGRPDTESVRMECATRGSRITLQIRLIIRLRRVEVAGGEKTSHHLLAFVCRDLSRIDQGLQLGSDTFCDV